MSNHQRPDPRWQHIRDRNPSAYRPEFLPDFHREPPFHRDYDRSREPERQSQYQSREYDALPYRGRNRRQDPHSGFGYGGYPASSPPDRSRDAPPLRDTNAYGRRRSETPPQRPSDGPYRNEHYRRESRNPKDTSSKPNNTYKGGCPFTNARAPVAERNLAQHDSPGSLHNSAPPRNNESSDDAPQHHRGNRHVTGPVKPVYSSQSPVKPASFRSGPKPKSSPLLPTLSDPARMLSAPRDAGIDSRNVGKQFLSDGTKAPALASNEQSQTDKRLNRTLSCEKVVRPEENRFSGQRVVRAIPVPVKYSAIARPTAPLSGKAPETVRHNERAEQHGSLTIPKSGDREMRDGTEDPKRVRNRLPEACKNENLIKRIFNKEKNRDKTPTRIPGSPDRDMSAFSTPASAALAERGGSNGIQIKEEQKFDAAALRVKPPPLRSAPAPPRASTLEDTPQRRAAAAAMQRALIGDHTGLKPRSDCSNLNGGRSPTLPTSGASYDSEARGETSSPQGTVPTRHRLTSSIANMNIVDRRESRSASERKVGNEDENQSNSQQVHSNENSQDRLIRAGSRSPPIFKRGANHFEESRETHSKRPRPCSVETVNVDDTPILRRSRRFQQPETNKTWETIKFEPVRVNELFLTQLKNQPMLLRISFLGMCDGDLRTTLDEWKGNEVLPEPEQRRLEVNNNRIRRITDEVCTRISALRVVSLNLSCNLLTTIGAKIGLSSKLRFLNVSRNRLSSLPQELCDLTNLEVLNMSHNEISRLPSGLCRLMRLEVLSLAWNKLEVLPEDVAAEGAVLSDLDVSNNENFHFFPRCAEHWTKLEVLHMPSTTIYKSLSRREHRLRPVALVKELAGRREDMFNGGRPGLRSNSRISSWSEV